jgi:hypothetical protein
VNVEITVRFKVLTAATVETGVRFGGSNGNECGDYCEIRGSDNRECGDYCEIKGSLSRICGDYCEIRVSHDGDYEDSFSRVW